MLYFVIGKDLAHVLVGPFVTEEEARKHIERVCLITGLKGDGSDGTSYTVKPANEINLAEEGITFLCSPQHDLELLGRMVRHYERANW